MTYQTYKLTYYGLLLAAVLTTISLIYSGLPNQADHRINELCQQLEREGHLTDDVRPICQIDNKAYGKFFKRNWTPGYFRSYVEMLGFMILGLLSFVPAYLFKKVYGPTGAKGAKREFKAKG